MGAPSTQADAPPEIDEQAWFEVHLIGEDGQPIPGERFVLVTPDGKTHRGFLDDGGAARVHGGRAGTADLTFPDLDERAWEPA